MLSPRGGESIAQPACQWSIMGVVPGILAHRPRGQAWVAAYFLEVQVRGIAQSASWIVAGGLAAVRPSRTVRQIAGQALLVLIGSLFVALCARVTIYLPFSPVPITGQTFGVVVVGATLGSRLGALALVAYLAEGLAGLPVFSAGATWGIARLLSPTGGYLVGFVAGAWIVGRLGEAGWHRRLVTTALSLGLGIAVIYLAGLAGLLVYLSPERALAVGVLPFLIGDALKVALATSIVVGQRALGRG